MVRRVRIGRTGTATTRRLKGSVAALGPKARPHAVGAASDQVHATISKIAQTLHIGADRRSVKRHP